MYQGRSKSENRPKPQQSKLTKQQVKYLRSLEQRQKDVQDKMNQNKNHTLSQPIRIGEESGSMGVGV